MLPKHTIKTHCHETLSEPICPQGYQHPKPREIFADFAFPLLLS